MSKIMQLEFTPFERSKDVVGFINNVGLFLSANRRRKARVVVGHTEVSVAQMFGKKKSISLTKIAGDDVYLCRRKINVFGEKQGTVELEWALVLLGNTGVFFIISFESGKYFRKYIHRYFVELYPMVSSVYLSTLDVINIIKNTIDEMESCDVRINKMNLRKRIVSQGAQRKVASSLEWSDILFDDLLEKIEEEDAWIKSLQMTYNIPNDDKVISSQFSIHRDGKFICSKNFDFFFYNILNKVIHHAVEKKKLLENRGRCENQDLAIRPLVIEFSHSVFSDKMEMVRFRESMTKFSHSGLSVHHQNPYYRASLIDYIDGSTYTIWILNSTSVIVSPRMRATMASLKRVYTHINDTFMEGKLRDQNEN